MHWNYRVIKKREKYGDVYYIHEAYYEGDDPRPTMISENPIAPLGDSLEELKGDLEYMVNALADPVIDWDEWVSQLNK